jgi:hypothetical protein
MPRGGLAGYVLQMCERAITDALPRTEPTDNCEDRHWYETCFCYLANC